MVAKFELYPFKVGELLVFKKKHPCGSYHWEVLKVGANISVKCERCARQLEIPRRKIEKMIKEVENKNSDFKKQKDE